MSTHYIHGDIHLSNNNKNDKIDVYFESSNKQVKHHHKVEIQDKTAGASDTIFSVLDSNDNNSLQINNSGGLTSTFGVGETFNVIYDDGSDLRSRILADDGCVYIGDSDDPSGNSCLLVNGKGDPDTFKIFHGFGDLYHNRIEVDTGQFSIRSNKPSGGGIFFDFWDRGAQNDAQGIRMRHRTGAGQIEEDWVENFKLSTRGHMQILSDNFIDIGVSADLIIGHDGTDSSITNATGNLNIVSTAADKKINFKLADDTIDESLIVTNNGGAELFKVNGDKTIDILENDDFDYRLRFENKASDFGINMLALDDLDIIMENAYSDLRIRLGNNDNSRKLIIQDSSAVDVFSVTDSGVITTQKGTVTQITTINTAVTLNEPAGVITTVSATIVGSDTQEFTVNCDKVSASSNILINVVDYFTFNPKGIPVINVDNIVDNVSFDITVSNAHPTNSIIGILKIGFQIL
jgi:hypothetical protein